MVTGSDDDSSVGFSQAVLSRADANAVTRDDCDSSFPLTPSLSPSGSGPSVGSIIGGSQTGIDGNLMPNPAVTVKPDPAVEPDAAAILGEQQVLGRQAHPVAQQVLA